MLWDGKGSPMVTNYALASVLLSLLVVGGSIKKGPVEEEVAARVK
jgi:hypothetical protein